MLRTDATDTIVAPATPPGEGGIGIVRLSGSDSQALLGKVFSGHKVAAMQSHRLYHGHLQRPDGTVVDEVLAVVMRAPHSYTCEDVVEVHCHGGTQVLRNVLDLFLEAGARLARPGEFTLRAFLGGRLDLAQAEAVADVIRARSEKSCRVALGQLEGRLSRELYRFTDQLRESLVLIEAHIDFPDDEVGALELDPVLAAVASVRADMVRLVESFDTGRVLRDGLSVLILGRPNVGKSSLMNALLGEARAIVTDVPGTTRDTLEENFLLSGYPVRLIDTAGVRETSDPIEREGVERARAKVVSADLVFLVVDGSVGEHEEDRLAASLCPPERTLLVINKSDKGQAGTDFFDKRFVRRANVSAKHGLGLDRLQSLAVSLFDSGGHDIGEDAVVTERRHREALLRSAEALDRFLAAASDQLPLECLAVELHEALSALGQITGETTPDAVLEQIFTRFCVGK